MAVTLTNNNLEGTGPWVARWAAYTDSNSSHTYLQKKIFGDQGDATDIHLERQFATGPRIKRKNRVPGSQVIITSMG